MIKPFATADLASRVREVLEQRSQAGAAAIARS